MKLLVQLFAVVMGLLAPGLAHAVTTLAVLPLEPGATSEAYQGLGKALSGMIVSDLSEVESLQLVERARIQSLLDEISLSDSGYLDPATATKAGRGAGAAFVLMGSYSVVAEQFLMDAQIVEVESGEVRKGASASGAVSDFVTVEKDLIEGLLDNLQVALSSGERRRIIAKAPTEDFGAFSTYGEGLDHMDNGRLEEARGAFEKALAADPEFAEAKGALGELRAMLEELATEREGQYSAAYQAMNDRVLATHRDSRELPDGAHLDMDVVVGVGLRWAALENLERHCQRYEEMHAWLDRVDWVIEEPPRKQGRDEQGRERGVYSYEMGLEAKDLGFERASRQAGGPPIAQSSPTRSAQLWRGTGRFVVGGKLYEYTRDDPHSGMLASVLACYPAEDALDEIDRLRAQARKHGADTALVHSNEKNITLDMYFQAIWGLVHADKLGGGQELTTRMERFLASVRVDDATTASKEDVSRENWVVSRIETITRNAELHEQWANQMMRLSQEEIERFGYGFAEGDPDVVTLDSPYCASAAKMYQAEAKAWTRSHDKAMAEGDAPQWTLRSAIRFYGPLKEGGCLVGDKATIESFEDAVAMLQVAVEKSESRAAEDSTCSAYHTSAQGVLNSAGGFDPKQLGDAWTTVAISYVQTVYMLKVGGCIAD